MAAERTRRRGPARIHPLIWVAGVIVAAALVAWPLGGWDTVVPASARIPQLAPHATHVGEQFSTRIIGATIGRADPTGYGSGNDEFLVVTADVRNETDEPEDSFRDLLRIAGPGDELDGLYTASDATASPVLNPGLRTRLLFAWKVPAGRYAAGQEVTFSIIDKTPFESALSTGTRWDDPHIGAQVTL
ncbi:MAG TPA: hypothetical protein VN759_04325, partial [Pseudolysinimonas sp.]|nr:hypothetical protein [Pseudolysinimonas sp.]